MVGFDEIRDAHNLLFLGSWMFLQKLRNDAHRRFHPSVLWKSKTNIIKFWSKALAVFQLYLHILILTKKFWMASFFK